MVEEENDNHYDKKISPTDLYASLVANVTQASMLMLLYLPTLKLPLPLLKLKLVADITCLPKLSKKSH